MNTDCVERSVAGSRRWSGICWLNEGLERGHFLKCTSLPKKKARQVFGELKESTPWGHRWDTVNFINPTG